MRKLSAARFIAQLVFVTAVVACGAAKPKTSAPSGGLVLDDTQPQSAADAAPVAKRISDPSDVHIVMSNGRFSINGWNVPDEPTVAQFESVFGPADRTSAKLDNLRTYDKLGLILYEAPKTSDLSQGFGGVVESISVYMGPKDYDFVPHSIYTGTLVIEGKTLDRKSAYATLSKLPGVEQAYGDSISLKGKVHALSASSENVTNGGLTTLELEFQKSEAGEAVRLAFARKLLSESAAAPPAAAPPATQNAVDYDWGLGTPTPPKPAAGSKPTTVSPYANAGVCAKSTVDCGTYCCPAGATCKTSTHECVRMVRECPGGTTSCGDSYCCPYGTSCAGSGMCRSNY